MDDAINFWMVHGIFFLIFITMFPRLTMLITGIFFSFFGFWFFLGWLLAPRLTVAILATIHYWETNPVLCVIAWLVAVSGESTEKKVCSNCGGSSE